MELSVIQELDNGFFEKFGTCFAQQVSKCESAPPQDADSGVGEDITSSVSIAEIDTEEEDISKRELITDAMGWNIEELYSEILFEILHNVGCDVESSEEQSEIINYLQQAFHLEDEKHLSLLEAVRAKEAPNILLNVEVIEAKDLRPKDANGLSDPFCTLYLSCSPTHRYNTSVKSETLCPVWEEHFSLPVQNPAEDVLWVEVWDFDPAETVREKITKIGEVKGVRGLRKLLKEIAITASTGKHDNELVGSTNIPLRSIPASGLTYWCSLEKKTKTKKQGNVKVKLSFSSEKNTQVSSQEYRHLLRLLLLHELENSKVEAYQWSGNFSSLAKDILTQHIAQSGLNSTAVTLAQWVEFSSVHVDHHLSFGLFQGLIEKLSRSIQFKTLSDDEIKLFWEGAKKLLPSCVNSIRKIRKLTGSDKGNVNQVSAILNICAHLQSLEMPEKTDLFPSNIYGWLNINDVDNYDVKHVIRDAVRQGATDWFNYIVDSNKNDDYSTEGKLRHLIKIIHLVRSDIQKAIEYYDKIFHSTLRFSYAQTLYSVYEKKVAEMTQDEVINASNLLKPIHYEDGPAEEEDQSEMLNVGTTLFELYLGLQRFAMLGTGLSINGTNTYDIGKFHLWFHRGVAQWLDIASYKAMQRIEKAADLDNLKPVDASVKYSSSAVDTLAIFYQIKIFWKQLAWPDVEGSYTFVAKIIDDICRCCGYYADLMTEKVEGLGESQNTVYEQKFQVTPEWCLAINNIDYVRNSIRTFIHELGMEDIIKALADFQSPTAANHCKNTLINIIESAIETVGNKILELQDTVVNKMMPSINRFLVEGAEVMSRECNSIDRLMQYLDENLMTLHEQLNEDNFKGILNIICEKIADLLKELVESSLEKRRPPSFFSKLHETVQILKEFFKKGDDCCSGGKTEDACLKKIENLLELHGLETWELIHQFNLERLKEQNELEDADLGMLTIRAQFMESVLKIEVMNARNLKGKDSNGSCDPYVKVVLLPEEKFASVPKPKTRTHKKTAFPLFDELFTLQLTDEQMSITDGLVHFIIKDQDFLGNDFLGESYLDFNSIPKTDYSVNISSLPQMHLKLHRPTNFNSCAYKAIEHRQGDKLAKDFIKKQKAKLPH
ncbi:UNVERIFIED_CONTAM: hypothetical protein PYX00_007554 [Menopon gallinae]|uniref:Protein unc-13 homolog 4B n=1 Tax=Menopon gallinae TaxID=328185 RepID=A0AAW2HJL6_9NEOP